MGETEFIPNVSYPDWKEMPESVRVLVVTWKHVFGRYAHLGKEPTREDIIGAWQILWDDIGTGRFDWINERIDGAIKEFEGYKEARKDEAS